MSGEKRRAVVDEDGPYAQAVLAAEPVAYWRMNEFVPPHAIDSSGHGNHATYDGERGVAFYLLGVGNGMGASSQPSRTTMAFSGPHQLNRAPHFAGGSMRAELPKLGADYTMTCCFWNGLDPKARATTGVSSARSAERLRITGTSGEPGRLFFTSGDFALSGKSQLPFKDWHHVALVRSGKPVAVFLDGKLELSGEFARPPGCATLDSAVRSEGGDTLEGRIDEAAVFDRALSAGGCRP